MAINFFLNINVFNLTTQKERPKMINQTICNIIQCNILLNVCALTPWNYNLAYLPGDIYNTYVWYVYFGGDHHKFNYAICYFFLQLVYCSGKT
jgi:hypothetical protein